MKTTLRYIRFLILFILTLQFNALFATCGNTIFVKADATGLNNGSSWIDAYTELQLALDEVKQCLPVVQEVWVAYGNYKPTVDIAGGATSGGKNRVFYINFDIELYGGFCGWETDKDQRIKYLCPSILSGDHDENDVLIKLTTNPNFPADSVTDNSYNVMRLKCLTAATVIDEFTIRGGRAYHASTFSKRTGGGIYIDGNSCAINLTISNCIFEHNSATRAGGGLFHYFKSNALNAPKFLNNIFRYNYSPLLGGAIAGQTYEGIADPLIQNCLFYVNISGFGGSAMSISALSTGVISHTIENCTFHRNYSTEAVLTIASETIAPDQVDIVNSIFNNSGGGQTALIQKTNVNFSHCIYPESNNTNNNLNGTPSFESFGHGDYRLEKGSIGINQGAANGSNLYDLNGSKRSIGQIDIGAYEYLECPSSNYIFVDDDNLLSSGSGATIGDAIGDLSLALEVACDCDSIPTIEIAPGNYTPSRNRNFYPEGSNNTFRLQCSANIIGQRTSYSNSKAICNGDIYKNDETTTNSSIAYLDNIGVLWSIENVYGSAIVCKMLDLDFTASRTTIYNAPRQEGCDLSLKACHFYNNSKQQGITFRNAYQGTNSTSYKLSLAFCKFSDNGDPNSYSRTLVMTSPNKVTAEIKNCTFFRNRSVAISYNCGNNSTLDVSKCAFVGDSTLGTHGIYASTRMGSTSDLKIENSIFTNMEHGQGHIISLDQTNNLRTKIENCTFKDIEVNQYVKSIIHSIGTLGHTDISNSIFWNTRSRHFNLSNTSLSLGHSLFENDCAAMGIVCDSTIIQNAPNPFDTNSASIFGGSVIVSTSLNSLSLARDSGNNLVVEDNEKDRSGGYRILNNTVDIGAKEYQPPCLSHLILDTNQEPFIDNNGVYGTWFARDTITVIGELHSLDSTYLTLIAPNVFINGGYERSGGGILDIYSHPCPEP